MKKEKNQSEKTNVIYANACYSGGGIYLYIGTLSNGCHFIADDTNSDFSITLCDVLPDFEEMSENDFFENHVVKCLNDAEPDTIELYKNILLWMIENKPEGNYNTYDLQNRLTNLHF